MQLVTSAHFLRLSLMKAAHADISSAAYGRSGSLGVLTQCFLIDIVRSVKVLSRVARICLGLAASGLAAAQFQVQAQSTGAPEWPTGSFDQQRDGWQRNETKITVDNAKNIRLLWKLKTDNKPMGMQSFREPLIVAGVNAGGGVKTVAILAGSSDDVYAVDAASGTLLWQKHLKWASDKPEEPGQGAGFICNNALTATPVVTPAGAAQRFVYVLGNDGYLRTLDLATGDETGPPIQMLPAPYGKAYGLNLVNNIVYTVSGQACHGVPNELYAVDLANKKAFNSTPPQGGIFGTAGPAIGADGTIYFETGDGAYDVAAWKVIDHRGGLYLLQRQSDAQGLLHPQQPRVADQARPGHEHHSRRLSLSRDGISWLAQARKAAIS